MCGARGGSPKRPRTDSTRLRSKGDRRTSMRGERPNNGSPPWVGEGGSLVMPPPSRAPGSTSPLLTIDLSGHAICRGKSCVGNSLPKHCPHSMGTTSRISSRAQNSGRVSHVFFVSCFLDFYLFNVCMDCLALNVERYLASILVIYLALKTDSLQDSSASCLAIHSKRRTTTTLHYCFTLQAMSFSTLSNPPGH